MTWRTSSYSQPYGDCVEAAGGVRVRDSRSRAVVLTFTPAAWTAFLERVKAS